MKKHYYLSHLFLFHFHAVMKMKNFVGNVR
jgi:hypothetical protein